MKTKKELGFTLVELLVVIAIIGILSTVAVVNLNTARQKARVAALKSTMSAILKASLLCESSGGQVLNGATPTSVVCNNPLPNPPPPGPSIVYSGGTLCIDPDIKWPEFPSGTTGIQCWYLYGEFGFGATIDGVNVTCGESGCS